MEDYEYESSGHVMYDAVVNIRKHEDENELEKMTGYKMKIVEEAGDKLIDMLRATNPWKGEYCGREDCWLCQGDLHAPLHWLQQHLDAMLAAAGDRGRKLMKW